MNTTDLFRSGAFVTGALFAVGTTVLTLSSMDGLRSARGIDASAATSRTAASEQTPSKFSYAAQFTCGFDPAGAFARIVPGQYATAVNIHNPGTAPITLIRRVALTFPDGKGSSAPVAGLVSDSLKGTLGPGEALHVDCGEIPSEFFPGLPLPPYVQGFLVIESRSSLDVTATTTAASIDALGVMEVQAIDVRDVPERRL